MVAKPVPPHDEPDNAGPLDARIEARCSAWAKETIQRAAAESGRSVSDFVVAAAMDSARALLLDQRVLRLDEQETRMLLDALDRPAQEMPGLRAAVQCHRELFGEEAGDAGRTCRLEPPRRPYDDGGRRVRRRDAAPRLPRSLSRCRATGEEVPRPDDDAAAAFVAAPRRVGVRAGATGSHHCDAGPSSPAW